IVSYSRIYLGVHFPMDVFFGGTIRILISTFIFEINKSITK
ncbi:MAG: phosphatase PAP2 family protein, partial [Leadbetterella sp.]|nr:phosphatase PAP2 family protein [Leadbetterella sp.]